MKKYRYAVLALSIGAALALVFLWQSTQTLQVAEVGSDPAAFPGTVRITGITGAFSPQDPTLFGIMDIEELQDKNPNGRKAYLPVRYQGKLPAFGDEVRVTGTFQRQSGGHLFIAKKVQVLKNHKL